MAERKPRLKRGVQHPLSAANELPPCLGPKPHVFKPQYAPIKWIERIDGGEYRDGPSGTQGFVFKFEIESREYAIKVVSNCLHLAESLGNFRVTKIKQFKFYDPQPNFEYWSPFLDNSVTSETLALHMDPFYAECRAYGRIHDTQTRGSLKQDIVVPCHGFRFLETHDEDDLINTFGIDLERKAEDVLPARAILKEHAPGESSIDDESADQVLRDIRQLNKAKVYNKDIRVEDFKNAKLLDFGSAWTEPHCILDCLDKAHKRDAKDERVEDLVQFDQMVEDNDIETRAKAMKTKRKK